MDRDPSLRPLAWLEFRRLTMFARKLHSSDTRDMISAWFGLIRALGIDMPPPDYSSSAAEVFRGARVALLTRPCSSPADYTEKEWSLISSIQRVSSNDSPKTRRTLFILTKFGHIEEMCDVAASPSARSSLESPPTPTIGTIGQKETEEDSISETNSVRDVEMDLQSNYRKHLELVLPSSISSCLSTS